MRETRSRDYAQSRVDVPAVETREPLGGIFIRHLRLVESLMRRVLELAGTRNALEDAVVRYDAVPDQLNGRPR